MLLMGHRREWQLHAMMPEYAAIAYGYAAARFRLFSCYAHSHVASTALRFSAVTDLLFFLR